MLTLEKTVQKKFPALPSANMAVRKVGYDQAGGFDPSIGWGYDIDLTKKLAERGVIFFDKNFNVETSFRRYYGKSPNNLGAFFRSIKELMVAIYRMMSMHITSKKFSAQEEIRD